MKFSSTADRSTREISILCVARFRGFLLLTSLVSLLFELIVTRIHWMDIIHV